MRIVADENTDAAVVRALRADGHDVTWIAEVEPAASDEDVLGLANRGQALLITEDKDFGELVYRRRLVTAGVLLIRLAGQPSANKAETVRFGVGEHGQELVEAFSVVSPESLRVRRPPEPGPL